METESQDLLALGHTLFDSNEFVQAAKCYREYLLQNPSDLNAIFRLGQACLQTESLDEAQRCFQILIGIIPENSAFLWLLGRTLLCKGAFEEAENFYNQAAKRMPENAMVVFELGVVYTRQGRYEKAISQFKQALQWKPDFAQAEQYLRQTEAISRSIAQQASAAFLYLQNGKFEKAEEVYRSMLAVHPANALACYFLGHGDDVSDALLFAQTLRYYWTDQLPQADSLCRQALRQDVNKSWAYSILGMIAERVGRTDLTIEYYGKAMISSRASQPGGNCGKPRFLLIKAWGSGFWSDFEHVLGQLFWAEVLEREPIVYWGPESLYSNGSDEDIFTKFFLPVSQYSIGDVSKAELSYYPACWRYDNLSQFDRQTKLCRYRSESWGIEFFSRTEDVIVSDIHIFVDVLLPWIPRQHALYGGTSLEVYRYVLSRYIKLQPHLAAMVETFYKQHMEGRNFIAVHARGGDRTESVSKLQQNNEEYFQEINRICAAHPEMHVFLLTDSECILNAFVQMYGDRVVYTQCTRSQGAYGVHYLSPTVQDKQGLAVETIVEVYLAVTCDYFIGCNSNVSTMILRLKYWENNTALTFGHLPSDRL